MERDFDMEKVIDKMRSLRDKRDLEILNQELKDIDLNSSDQKKLSDNKVLNVKYLGVIKIEGEEKGIYLVIEQKAQKDGTLAQIERYYTEDGEFLGGDNSIDEYDFLTLDEKYMNNKDMLEKLQSIDKDGILNLNKIEQERIEEVAKESGIIAKELEKMSEIDSKKEIEKISTKSEIDTNRKVTDKETMASILNVQDKGYKKIAIIYSDKMQDNGNTTRFSFVGIKEDGTAEKIDTIEQAYGRNPSKEINSVNRDGSKVEQEQVNSIYRIKGKKETQIAVDIGAMGTIEPSLVRTPAQDNEEAISIPIETHNVRPTTRETRELMNEQRNPRVKEEIQRAKENQELRCDDISLKDIDDNPNNNTHEHIEISEEYLDKCATKILENDEVSSIYNRNDVINRLKENIEKSREDIQTEELLEQVENQMEEEAKDEHQLPQRDR